MASRQMSHMCADHHWAAPTQPCRSRAWARAWDGASVLATPQQAPGQGSWTLPAAARMGETAEEADRREVREECNVNVEISRSWACSSQYCAIPDDGLRVTTTCADFLAYYRSGRCWWVMMPRRSAGWRRWSLPSITSGPPRAEVDPGWLSIAGSRSNHSTSELDRTNRSRRDNNRA